MSFSAWLGNVRTTLAFICTIFIHPADNDDVEILSMFNKNIDFTFNNTLTMPEFGIDVHKIDHRHQRTA